MRKPSCITCINTCCLNPSLSWMIPLLTASQNHWRCCSNIWYYIANITIFFPFLIPLTPKDNDTFQWYWRCLWNLNIFQWSFAKWCYDLFIANERCLIHRFEENDNLLSSFSNEAICIDLSFLRAKTFERVS